jgi:hypothetical protein
MSCVVEQRQRREGTMKYYGVGELATQLATQIDVAPRLISDLFYSGKLDRSRCPIIAGRRLIPEDYVLVVERVVREAVRGRELARVGA